MDMKLITIFEPISREGLRPFTVMWQGAFVKAVVDLEHQRMVVGGELHADEEAMLLNDSSVQRNLWGINLYPDTPGESWIEFNSMINIRPSQGNRSRGVEDVKIQEKIREVVELLVRET